MLGGSDDRALVTSSGRVIATSPQEWMPAERLALPAYGGEFTLPSGVPAFAEPLDRDGAFLIRRLEHAPAGHSGGAVQLRVLGDDHPHAVVDGRPLPLGRRQAEILALLCLHPGGLTTEQLGSEVYGDDASNSTVRGEVSRLRKQLGLAIETDPYRFVGHVESDLGRVRALLERGAIQEAAELYAGPLLPHSDAPGVERERQALEGWIRHAVMTGDDREAVWAWVQTPSGREDAAAWRQVLLGAGLPRPAAQPGGGAGRAAARALATSSRCGCVPARNAVDPGEILAPAHPRREPARCSHSPYRPPPAPSPRSCRARPGSGISTRARARSRRPRRRSRRRAGSARGWSGIATARRPR